MDRLKLLLPMLLLVVFQFLHADTTITLVQGVDGYDGVIDAWINSKSDWDNTAKDTTLPIFKSDRDCPT